MSFLDDLKNFLNPKPVANSEVKSDYATQSTVEQSKVENATLSQTPSEQSKTYLSQPEQQQESVPQIFDTVISNISKLLQPLQGKDDFKGVAIYATEKKYFVVLDKSFEKKLRLQFDNLGFQSLGNGKLEIYEESPTTEADDVYNNKIFIKIFTQETSTIRNRKARITVFHGKGSLKQPEYVLDTQANKKTVYNIGRGDLSNKNGVFRENDIIINDTETNTTIANLNSFVSSSHANIEFINGEFLLHAMPSGISNGNATKIIRGDKVNKIETESMLYPLQDGDIIELGRSVYLKFEILQ